jgi:hypothetical protein
MIPLHSMTPRSVLVALIVFLPACAAPPAHWEKAGASQTAVDEAMQQCQVQSRLSPQQHRGPTPRTTGTPGMDRVQSRDADEAEQVRKCMLDKGYSQTR